MKMKLGENEVMTGVQLNALENKATKDGAGDGMTKTKEIRYPDIKRHDEDYSLKNTIREFGTTKDIFININKKYKIPYLKNDDIVLPIVSENFIPKYIDFNDTSQELSNSIYSRALIVVRANTDKVLPKFLFFMMLSETFRNRLREKAIKGKVMFPRITVKILEEMEIDVPSITEQEQVVLEIKKVNEKIQKHLQEIEKDKDKVTEIMSRYRA